MKFSDFANNLGKNEQKNGSKNEQKTSILEQKSVKIENNLHPVTNIESKNFDSMLGTENINGITEHFERETKQIDGITEHFERETKQIDGITEHFERETKQIDVATNRNNVVTEHIEQRHKHIDRVRMLDAQEIIFWESVFSERPEISERNLIDILRPVYGKTDMERLNKIFRAEYDGYIKNTNSAHPSNHIYTLNREVTNEN